MDEDIKKYEELRDLLVKVQELDVINIENYVSKLTTEQLLNLEYKPFKISDIDDYISKLKIKYNL